METSLIVVGLALWAGLSLWAAYWLSKFPEA